MYCPTCGNEISVELKYCNRCGANLAIVPESYPAVPFKPTRLSLPAIVLGLTVTIGLGLIFSGAAELAEATASSGRYSLDGDIQFGHFVWLYGADDPLLVKGPGDESRSLSAANTNSRSGANTRANVTAAATVSAAS